MDFQLYHTCSVTASTDQGEDSSELILYPSPIDLYVHPYSFFLAFTLVYIDFHFGWLDCRLLLHVTVIGTHFFSFFFSFSLANILVALFQFRKCTVALVIEMLTLSLKLAFHPSGILQWRREGGIFGGLFCLPSVDIFNQSDQFKRICFLLFVSLVEWRAYFCLLVMCVALCVLIWLILLCQELVLFDFDGTNLYYKTNMHYTTLAFCL